MSNAYTMYSHETFVLTQVRDIASGIDGIEEFEHGELQLLMGGFWKPDGYENDYFAISAKSFVVCHQQTKQNSGDTQSYC